MIKTFIILQKIYIFQINAVLLNFPFIKETWKKRFLAANQNIRVISEASCDWINDAKKFSFEITGINCILKYIQIENSYFK